MSALIDPRTLYSQLSAGHPVKLIDATWPPRPGMPVIGNAQPFDIDEVADLSSPMPHTLPPADIFAHAVGAMGIGNDDEIVVYDQSGMAMAAARVWWMFRVFGHKNVKILDGGLPLWHAMGLPLSDANHVPPPPVSYTTAMKPDLFANRDEIIASLDNPGVLIADARARERFAVHIPGSTNVPYASLLDPATGMMRKNDPTIMAIISENPDRIISSCGSGVTACVVALAFHEAGREDVAIYGGSWSEWSDPSLGLPVERGSGRMFQLSEK